MDAVLLSRAQFALHIGFHILFPTLTIALGWVLLFFRWRWRRTQDPRWRAAYHFWTQVFALSFALGVVSGVVMSFQFGTNWPGFMERVGNVAGPLLGFEVLTAFFLEATFLGVMLYGEGRVGERMHLLATALVAIGTTLSAFWILALNSWMQTPAGHVVRDGEFHVADWLGVLFNPSFPYRLVHMLLASGLSVAFLLAGLAAWQLWRGRSRAWTAPTLRTGLTLGAALIPLQIVAGDLHGLNTLAHQPQKIAAMEAVWHTERGAPLLLFAWPDAATQSNRYPIAIPRGASLILKHHADAEIQGLDAFPGATPPVAPVFWAFRVMVGVGLLMLATSWSGWWLLRRHGWAGEHLPHALLALLSGMTFSGWLATLAGWTVTEVGRQPFVVYGLLRTADIGARVPAASVAGSLALYVALYAALVLAYVAVLGYRADRPDLAPSPGGRPSPGAALDVTRGRSA
jgi:cytochrome d ubiquinol oxidase subunit I